MPIPGFQSFMLPVLIFLSDGLEHTNQEMVGFVSNYLNLTDEEKMQRLQSGTKTIVYDRALWAKTYLRKALLVENTTGSNFWITQRGLDVVKEGPKELSIKYLRRFEEFSEYFGRINDNKEVKTEIISKVTEIDRTMTPQEAIDFGYQKLNENIAEDLIEKIKRCTPDFFENLVIQLLVKMGYGGSFKEAAGEVTGKVGDGGIDGLIKEDRLGLDIVYVQAKRWDQGSVGRPEVQKFVGALASKKSKKGIFITTSYYTKEAIEYAKSIDNNIVLIDGQKLAELMIEFNLGVGIQQTLEIKRIDQDFFTE